MKKLLVIEDNIDIRENLAEILALAGYDIQTAENGKIGVEIAVQFLPNLILCDVMMPVLDGFGAFKILRSKPQTADIPFIFLTAKAEKSDFRYGMNLGADDYITKPFETNELLQVIEMRLQKAEKANQMLLDTQVFVNEAQGEAALNELTRERESRHFDKKNVIYAEGTVPRFFYFIKSGKVKIFKHNDYAKELIVNILGKEQFFGYVDLFNGGYYGASAAMLEEGELILVPKEDFFKLVQQNRDVANWFVKLLSENIGQQQQQLVNLAYNSVRKRVADALTRLHEHYAEHPIVMLREDLAALAGTAKETAIRTLTDFREEKMIDIEDNKIQILRPDKLKSLIN